MQALSLLPVSSLIPLCRVDFVQQRAALFETADVVEDDRGGGRRVGGGGGMRRYDDARVVPERVPGRQRLVAEDVEHGGGEVAGGERAKQVFFDQMRAAGGVYHGGTPRQHRKGLRI